MEQKLIPAPIDEKNIFSDFINDFMQDWNEYRNGHYHAIIGAPLETNKPFICEWNDNYNWLRFRPVDTLGYNPSPYERQEDLKRIANEFCKEHDEGLLVIKEVNAWGVRVEFYFKDE